MFFLAISILFIVVLLLLYILTMNVYYLYMCLISGLIAIVINWILSRVNDVHVRNNRLYIGNLYHSTKIVEASDFEAVINIKLFIPVIYPFFSPPYYQIRLKNGETYIFYDLSYKALSSVFAKNNKHSEFLTSSILKHLTAYE